MPNSHYFFSCDFQKKSNSAYSFRNLWQNFNKIHNTSWLLGCTLKNNLSKTVSRGQQLGWGEFYGCCSESWLIVLEMQVNICVRESEADQTKPFREASIFHSKGSLDIHLSLFWLRNLSRLFPYFLAESRSMIHLKVEYLYFISTLK